MKSGGVLSLTGAARRTGSLLGWSIFAAIAIFYVGCVSIANEAVAEAFPSKPVKIVVSTPPGASVDLVARLFAQHLSELWNQTVYVENKAGANGQIAVNSVATSKPDGYTLLITTAGTLSTNAYLYPKSGELSVSGLESITMLVAIDFLISVRPELGVKTFSEFLDYSRKNPGKLNVATNSRGAAFYLAAELLKRNAKIDFTIVPFSGGSAGVTSILSGVTDAIIETTTLTVPLVQSGKLVPLAATASARSRFFPNVPTVEEAGVCCFNVTGWLGLVAPKGTPDDVKEKIYADVRKVVERSQVLKRLETMQSYPIINTPAEFERLWSAERAMWKDLIERSALQMEER